MSLPELSTPIRVYWDLTPIPADPPDHEKIAADIISLKILNLDIVATGAVLPESCPLVIRRCVEARLAVTLTVSPNALTTEAEYTLSANPPKEILFEIDDISQLETLLPLSIPVSGISFPVSQFNRLQIPGLIRLIADHGINRLVFPMQRLYAGEVPYYLSEGDRSSISASLADFLPPATLRITAHDPFIWRAIFPNTPFPNGRCQAANTMLAIDSRGNVYPCPVMPTVLGNLGEMTLKEIATGNAKKSLRNRLLTLPADCLSCQRAESCKGGCRGRGERIFGSWDAIDPGCR